MSTEIGEPLLLAPTFDAKPWGGRRLERYGKTLPDGLIGESLESGGDARIVGGSFDGWSVARLVEAHPEPLLGQLGVAASGKFGDFPLLVKLIDAHQDLSVQVHPDNERAPQGRRGKTEAWLVLDAEPGASLVTGLRGPLDTERIAEQLVRRAVAPGDVYLVPAGTVHAIGAGVLLYEVQQASDVTYRLYDWNRPREMHPADARRVMQAGSEAQRIRPLRIDERREMLVACAYFALERWTMERPGSLPSNPGSFRVVTVLDGSITIGNRRIPHGSSIILPADLGLTECAGTGSLLVAYVPDLKADVFEPLLVAGHRREDIDALGAVSR